MKLSANDIGKASAASLVIVAFLMLLSRFIKSDILFYLLYPGSALSLLITGGHGGTRAEDETALVISFLANTAAYAILGAVVLAFGRRLRR